MNHVGEFVQNVASHIVCKKLASHRYCTKCSISQCLYNFNLFFSIFNVCLFYPTCEHYTTIFLPFCYFFLLNHKTFKCRKYSSICTTEWPLVSGNTRFKNSEHSNEDTPNIQKRPWIPTAVTTERKALVAKNISISFMVKI